MSAGTACYRYVIALGALIATGTTALAAARPPSTTKAKLLFCASESIGLVPFSPPPDFARNFAVAVVEIQSPRKAVNAAVSDFALIDEGGETMKLKRVVRVENFDELGVAPDYLQSRRTRPWDGTIRAGTMRLRIRVALKNGPGPHPVRCRLKVGAYVIEGSLNEELPS